MQYLECRLGGRFRTFRQTSFWELSTDHLMRDQRVVSVLMARPSVKVREVAPHRGASSPMGWKQGLEQAAFSERRRFNVRHDDVIKHPHFNQGERVLQALSEELVRAGRLRDTTWMVVGEDHRGSV